MSKGKIIQVMGPVVGALLRKAFQAFLNLELNDKSILNSHLLKIGKKKDPFS